MKQTPKSLPKDNPCGEDQIYWLRLWGHLGPQVSETVVPSALSEWRQQQLVVSTEAVSLEGNQGRRAPQNPLSSESDQTQAKAVPSEE